MPIIPRKVFKRFEKNVSKYQGILKNAKDRDINEADTSTIIQDILENVFGYDKYKEITAEFAIRSTFSDLAVKSNDNINFLVEVKAIGLELKESHIRQAVSYGVNHGIQWVVLTNGIKWKIFRIRFEKPVNYELIYLLNFLEINPKDLKDQEKLFLLCKEGLNKDAIEEFHEHIKNVNRFTIAALVLNDTVLNVIRRELRRISEGLLVDIDEIEKIIRNEILKREVIEGKESDEAMARVKKCAGKIIKKGRKSKLKEETAPSEEKLPAQQ